MLTREEIFQRLRDQRAYLAAEYGVRRIGLFGSYAQGQPTTSSDIDLLVEFDRPIGFRFLELVDFLEALLGASVDVLTPAGVANIRVGQVARSIAQSIAYV
jgi:predicted nucleotidyltransferase